MPVEGFAAEGLQWWFGFHGVPGLAETVLEGHEGDYLDYFLSAHSVQPVPRDVRDAFVAAYTGREALRCGFEYYRAQSDNAARFETVLRARRLTMPTLAIAGGVVGEALDRQLAPITDPLETSRIEDCGHLVPLEQPQRLVQALEGFLTRTARAD